MQQFNLDIWLQDKNRKVVTRTGEEVKIIDTNAPDKNNPIVGYIYHKQKWNGPWAWHRDGFYKKDGDDMDLFFADEEPETIEVPFGAKDSEFIKDEYFIPEGCEARIEGNKVIIEKIQKEEELTEFEKQLGVYIYFPKLSCEFNKEEKKYIRDAANTLLGLARKELEKDYCIMEPFDVSDLKKEQRELGEVIGRTNALKSLPKWKKVDSNPAKFQYNLQGTRLYKDGEYYIELSDLETLPKEE